MGGGVDEGSRERSCEEISKSIALLEHSRDDAAGGIRTIFEGGGCRVAIESTHCNAKERSHGQELLIRLSKAGAKLKNDEQDIVDDEGPF